MTVIRNINTAFRDSASLDAFSRVRVSNPLGLFDAQFTYDLQPLIYEQLINGTGAAIAHDATDRNALMTFASTPTGGETSMQSYEHMRYQPMKSQEVAVTFNFIEGVANCLKFAGYSDGTNGFEFQLNGTTPQMCLLSATNNGNQTVVQTSWNIDKFDGTGDANNPSGVLLDISQEQIFIVDFQALYVGRVRMGFDIDGVIYYAHEFLHANKTSSPYIQTANLPVRCGMTCTGTVSTTMDFNCAAVASEGGADETSSYPFSTEDEVTAGNNTETFCLALRPKTTFNGITNRIKNNHWEVEITVTGNNPVEWKLVVGQALTGGSWSDVNSTYSGMQVNTTASFDGGWSPTLEMNHGHVVATNQVKSSATTTIQAKIPITLDATGAVRDLGTIVLMVKGLGGTSVTTGLVKWKEIR